MKRRVWCTDGYKVQTRFFSHLDRFASGLKNGVSEWVSVPSVLLMVFADTTLLCSLRVMGWGHLLISSHLSDKNLTSHISLLLSTRVFPSILIVINFLLCSPLTSYKWERNNKKDSIKNSTISPYTAKIWQSSIKKLTYLTFVYGRHG